MLFVDALALLLPEVVWTLLLEVLDDFGTNVS